ncbi:MAG: SDR family oxidoreductase [Alphaproteobacteria bacterium]
MIPVTPPSNDALSEKPNGFASDLMAGKRILISGASGGLGRATAWAMARAGAALLLSGRNEEKLSTLVEALRGEGVDADYVVANVRDTEQVAALFVRAAELGGIDVLVNSAGGQFPQDAMDFSEGGWRAVIDTNLNGTFWMMQAAAQAWRDAGRGGTIINVVTVVDRGMLGVSHTAAARAGVIAFSKSVAVEWAPYHIRVNNIAPGAIMTEGMAVYEDEVRTAFVRSNPQLRFGDAWEIASAAVYMGSDLSSFMTGQTITIDGGGNLWGELWTNGKPDYFK